MFIRWLQYTRGKGHLTNIALGSVAGKGLGDACGNGNSLLRSGGRLERTKVFFCNYFRLPHVLGGRTKRRIGTETRIRVSVQRGHITVNLYLEASVTRISGEQNGR